MKTLSEALLEEFPQVDLWQLKYILRFIENYKSNVRMNYCDVCGCLITDENRVGLEIHDYNHVCLQHISFRLCFNLDKIRKDFKITKQQLIDL